MKKKLELIYDVEKIRQRFHPVALILKDSLYFRAINFQRIVMENDNV